jgi:hypothetical protein
MILNPVLAATLRRHWPLVGAVGFFAVFWLAHQFLFEPAARRYQESIKQASDLGLPLDLSRAPVVIPPRVLALVAENALPAQEAQELGTSGQLTARLLEDLTRAMNASGLEVLATQPGTVTQQPRYVQVRAYVKVRGRYREIVGVMESLAEGKHLMALDRFSLMPEGDGGAILADLWLSRLVLKQERRK